MNRSYLNLGLAVVVAGLGVAVWLSQKQEDQGPALTALKQDAITNIVIEHPAEPTIRLEKYDGQWRLTEPVQASADSLEVGGILSLAELEVKKQFDAGVDLKQLELDPPRYRVTLDDVRIDIGGTEPIQYRRYVSSGEAIGVVDDPPSAALDADFSDLISKSVVPEEGELKKIELPGLLLEKSAEGAWTSPQQGEATAAQLAQLVESWKNARAMWNAAEPLEGSSGDTVKLTLVDGSVIDLIVHARDPQLVLARPELRVRYTLSKALVQELFELPPPTADIDADAAPADEPATEAVE